MQHLFLTLVLLSASAPAIAAQPVAGRWISDGGQSLVEIAPCGRALCGRIVKVLKPDPKRPKIDVRNPDPARRNQPIEGLAILTGFVDAGSYWVGKIYDPRSGKTYSSRLYRKADGTLTVKGCVAFLCGSQTWTPTK